MWDSTFLGKTTEQRDGGGRGICKKKLVKRQDILHGFLRMTRNQQTREEHIGRTQVRVETTSKKVCHDMYTIHELRATTFSVLVPVLNPNSETNKQTYILNGEVSELPL